jgi:DinB superfamily
MNELQKALIDDSYAAPPSHILEGISDELAHLRTPGSPHSIYEEVWHSAFWQDLTLEWIAGIQAPLPAHASSGFPSPEDRGFETWPQLRDRFLNGANSAATIAADEKALQRSIRCPTLPGRPLRTMSVRDQLESLASHNAYHLGRVVLLRQLNHSWPPKSGGYTW